MSQKGGRVLERGPYNKDRLSNGGLLREAVNRGGGGGGGATRVFSDALIIH